MNSRSNRLAIYIEFELGLIIPRKLSMSIDCDDSVLKNAKKVNQFQESLKVRHEENVLTRSILHSCWTFTYG